MAGNGPVPVLTAAVKNMKVEYDHFKINDTQTCGNQQRKRKMLDQFIDFWSLADKYYEKKIDQELDPELRLGRNPESVSTELSLSFGHSPINKKRKLLISTRIDDYDDIGLRIASPVDIVKDHVEPENLNHEEDLPENQWIIRKTLQRSDIDSSRLLLGKKLVMEHILPHLVGNINVKDGVVVSVWDVDTRTEHVLMLKQWKTGSFVMMKNWTTAFVKRRQLKENDEIGIRWDDENSRLEFTVLNGDRNQ